MKKIVILTNHSYMLYRFRRELIEELMKEHGPAEDGLISVEEFFWGDFDDMLLAGEIN